LFISTVVYGACIVIVTIQGITGVLTALNFIVLTSAQAVIFGALITVITAYRRIHTLTFYATAGCTKVGAYANFRCVYALAHITEIFGAEVAVIRARRTL
jgi:hypothetical protein